MSYNVKHIKTGEEKTLGHLDVNDMVERKNGDVIVFDTNLESYILINLE